MGVIAFKGHKDGTGASTITATPLGTGVDAVTARGATGGSTISSKHKLDVEADDWLAWQFGSSGVLSVTCT